MNDRQCQMVVTSVTGHLMELEVEPRYKPWDSCSPIDLFTVPVIKYIKEVRDFTIHA